MPIGLHHGIYMYNVHSLLPYTESVLMQAISASGKHVRAIYTPFNPLLYSKTGVCRGIPIFLIFAPKHRLWVLVRTASSRRFKRVRTIYVLSKHKKNINFLPMQFSIFTGENNLCVFVMCRKRLVWYGSIIVT